MLSLFLYALLALALFFVVGVLIDKLIRTFLQPGPEFLKLYNFVVYVVVVVAAIIFLGFVLLRIIIPMFSGHGL